MPTYPPAMLRRASLLLVPFLVMISSSDVFAHAGQHLGLRITIDDEQVVYESILSYELLAYYVPELPENPKLTLNGDLFTFDDSEEQQAYEQAVGSLIVSMSAVRIDGAQIEHASRIVKVVPAFDEAGEKPDPSLPPDTIVELHFPAENPPKHVSLIWNLYPDESVLTSTIPQESDGVPAELDAYDENRIITFTPQEPEHTWHRPLAPTVGRVSPAIIANTEHRLHLPIVSLTILVSWLVLVVAVSFSKASLRLRWPMLFASIIPVMVAILCQDYWVIKTRAPWAPEIAMPSAAQAKEIFSALHNQVYKAFDYKSESDVYDVLAESVDGNLLDRIYNEVYQSLIMRDQGGAVARIRNVEVLKSDLVSSGTMQETGRLAINVDAKWRVHGMVYHWGHVHSRTNEYRAIFTLAQREDRWKITEVEMIEQRRVVADSQADSPEAPAGQVKEPTP